MSFNTIIDWNSCSPEQQRELLMRPAISASESITRTWADAKTEFVTLSELNRRREVAERQGRGLNQGVSEADLSNRDVSVSQDKVISYMRLGNDFNASDIHMEISGDRKQ